MVYVTDTVEKILVVVVTEVLARLGEILIEIDDETRDREVV